MKQILIISGKGGTGKTVITGGIVSLAENKVIADCDVDAANMHLLLQPKILERNKFVGGQVAFIDQSKCMQCGRCLDYCRFDAVLKTEGEFIIDPISCEGCGLCKMVCPVSAIEMKDEVNGEWFVSETRFGLFVHAKLGVGQENSGKLVTVVKQKAKQIAEERNYNWIIIDGSPGIGCPVIASLSGVDCALVVTEPTLSALHDADRVIKVARHFGVPVKLVVNKYDLNLEMTEKIVQYCQDIDIPLIGKIPFDSSLVEAVVMGKTVIEHSDEVVKEEISQIWDRLRHEV